MRSRKRLGTLERWWEKYKILELRDAIRVSGEKQGEVTEGLADVSSKCKWAKRMGLDALSYVNGHRGLCEEVKKTLKA